MSSWAAIVILAVVGVMTYSMRAVAILALAHRTIPSAAERALRYVGPAVLAALTFNLAAGGDGGGPSMEPAEVLALLAAGGAAWWKKNLIVTLVAGMLTLWLASGL